MFLSVIERKDKNWGVINKIILELIRSYMVERKYGILDEVFISIIYPGVVRLVLTKYCDLSWKF